MKRCNCFVRSLLAICLLAACLAPAAVAEVTLPAVFSDHMVLQHGVPLPVWGWADAGEKVAVSIAGQSKEATAGGDGSWSLRLDPIEAGGPYEMLVRGQNTLKISDVLVGEVWLCSGQSNMAMTVRGVENADAEIAAAQFPRIRMLTVQRASAVEPQRQIEGTWQVASPETAAAFSATAYFFGRELHEALGVPVGLVNSSWGGTAVEAWTNVNVQKTVSDIAPVLELSNEAIRGYDAEQVTARYEKQMAAWKEAAAAARAAKKSVPKPPRKPEDPRMSQNRPGNLYNGMIAPLIPYAIRGAIWYQGERNSRDELSKLYGVQLQTLIGNWRDEWGQGDFPFLYVQLPNFMAPQQEPSENAGWVFVREGMLQTLSLANTGMAITTDIGDANNIHPKNKQEVGRRLALSALAGTYGRDVAGSGPIYRSMRPDRGKIVVEFDHVGGGLKTAGDGPLAGFAIAAGDRKFVWAEAVIDGDTVVVSSPKVKQPAAVRYSWAANPKGNLVNAAGLPASPFRTDDWDEPVIPR